MFWLLVCFTNWTVKWHNMHSLLLQHFAFKASNIAKLWNVFFSSMFPSLDNDCTIQDLAFQVLKPFEVINFSIRPKEELWFSCLGLPRHDHKKMIVKTWQTNFQNPTLFFQHLACQVLKCYIVLQMFANPCSQLLGLIALFKTWYSKSWTFWGKYFQ